MDNNVYGPGKPGQGVPVEETNPGARVAITVEHLGRVGAIAWDHDEALKNMPLTIKLIRAVARNGNLGAVDWNGVADDLDAYLSAFIATREQTDGADTSDAHGSQEPHKNTPIPAKQGEGLAADLPVDHALKIANVLWCCVPDDHQSAHLVYGELVEAITKLAAAPPLDEWQPISDAPKDGNPILSWDGRYISITFWRRTGLRHQWVSELTGAGQEPTHWKPLPQPPIGNLPNTEMENPNG